MKKATILLSLFAGLFLLIQLAGCKSASPMFTSAQKVEIWLVYPGDEGSNRVIFSSSQAEEVAKVAGFISSKDAPAYKCGYNAKIVFENAGGVKEEIDVNFDENCPHARFEQSGDFQTKVFTQEGIDFIKGLIRR